MTDERRHGTDRASRRTRDDGRPERPRRTARGDSRDRDDRDNGHGDGGERRNRTSRDVSSRRGTDPMRVSRTAMEQLSALTNCEAAGVSRLDSDGDGWVFQVEIIEVPRIPDTTSILASYETHTDWAGNIISYRRHRRYPRNQAGEM